MKKLKVFTVIFALLVALFIGYFIPTKTNANPKGYSIFDDFDGVFRCVVSPTSCDFSAMPGA